MEVKLSLTIQLNSSYLLNLVIDDDDDDGDGASFHIRQPK